MQRKKIRQKVIISLLTVTTILTAWGCSAPNIQSIFESREARLARLHESPLFLEHASTFQGYDNLVSLENINFNGKPYNDVRNFGDNLLLVGEGQYSGENFEYSFDVYNPWTDEIDYSLSHNEISCDYYLIQEDQLILVNDSKGKASIYDEELNLVKEVSSDKYTGYDFPEYITDSYYDPSLLGSSPSDRSMVISAINKESMENEIIYADKDNSKILDQVSTPEAYLAAAGDSGYIYLYNSGDSIWNYRTADKTDHFFKMDDMYSPSFISDDKLLLTRNIYDDEVNTDNFYYCFNENQGITSELHYKFNTSSKLPKYLSMNYAYLEDCDCLVFLEYSTDCKSRLLIWQLDKGSPKTVLSFYSSPEEVPDTSSLSYADKLTGMDEANTLATELENKYDIEIFIGSEIPASIDCYNTAQINDEAEVLSALNELDDILALYPDGFFSQLTYNSYGSLQFYLTGSITGDTDGMISEASGYVTNDASHIIMVLDVNYSWNWNNTINHEISHMIDRRLEFMAQYNSDCIFSEDTWSSYNPASFSYLQSYDGYENNTDYDRYPNYFVDSYGTTFPTEDRAQLFGASMENYISGYSGTDLFYRGSPCYEKLKYYCQCIRSGFDTSGWPDSLPWESLLQ